MSAKDYLKEEWKTEKGKMKNMSFKDKLWYIWEYYKVHILAVFLFGCIIAVIGNSIYRSTFETELYCVVINNASGQGLNTDILTKEFHEYMNFTDKQEITVESSSITYGDNSTEYNYASMAKISALVASKGLDLMICDIENMEHYAQLSGFLDLEQELPPDILELVRDRLYYATDESGTPYACGLSLDGTDFAKETNLSMDSILLGIVGNTPHRENIFALLRYIFAS